LTDLCGGARFEALFASESYGYKMAEVLDCKFVPVDTRRETVAISGTALRQDPFSHWERLHPVVRPYFVKRVAVAGLPSAEKAAFTRALAGHYHTCCAGDYAAGLLADFSDNFGAYEPKRTDVSTMARGQIASEEALARQANRLLFADSESLALIEYARKRFGAAAGWIEDAARGANYALTLLLDPAGFTQNPQPGSASPFGSEAEAFAWWQQALTRAGRRFTVIGGKTWDERRINAIEALDQVFFQKS
jgi:NadR type nicotinamide-nucleotide adenylyltransferase